MNSIGLRIKRAFDILVALLLIILLSPAFVLVSITILIFMGSPVFFKQLRLGRNGRPFTILKFRTMTRERDKNGALLPDGERLTWLGKLLRKTTLDEIPELYNVLKGDMSLVGPRPLLVEYKDLYTKDQWRRHEMPPGMAGPVLIGGRNALTWEEKFERDLWYVDNWSLWLDVKILFRTAVKVLKREGTSAQGHVTMPKFTGTRNGTSKDKG